MKKKYIDAEKLKRLLDEKYKEFMKKAKTDGYTTLQYQHMADGIDIAEQLIDSLQQEQPEVFDTMAFQKGVKEGKRLAIETIRARIDEILGDAQPAPILRMELQELIKKIEA